MEEEVKNMIVEKYGSVRQFAQKIGLANSTIDSILRRGFDNSNVSNIIKICKELNISADKLLDEHKIVNIDDIYNASSNTNDSTIKECDTLEELINETKLDLLEQYKVLFDKDDRLTEEQKKFFMDFLEERHKRIDEKEEKGS